MVDEELEEDNNHSKEHRKLRIKMFTIYFVVAIAGLIGLGYICYNTYQQLSFDKFCSQQIDGIYVFKGKFILCVKKGSTILTDYHNYTKAICNATNYCIDSLIYCSGEKLIDIVPLGDGIQFGEKWVDKRDPKDRWGWCNAN